MAFPQFTNQQNLAAMLNPQTANLGQLIGAPIAQGMARADQNQRLDDQAAQKQQLLQQENDLRDDTAEAVAFLQQPKELWQQTLSAKYTEADEAGDYEERDGIGRLMQMDTAGLEQTMTEAAIRGSHLLPSGALQGAGFGGASDKNIGGKTNFVKQVGTEVVDGREVPVFQNFSITLTQGAGGVSAGETAFGPTFTEAQGNPIISAKVEAAGSEAFEKATGKDRGESVTAEIAADTIAKKEEKKEAAKLKAQFKLQPKIATAVATATANVRAMADAASENKSNSKALEIYELGIKGLADAMGKDSTGTVTGMLTAFTDDAKVSNGALAAMAPILKQLFRASGEGTFTKDDQQILMDMLPTRNDSAKVRASKLANVDAIVRSKLAAVEADTIGGESEASPAAQLPSVNNQGWGLMTDANGNKAYVGPNGEVEEVQ